MKIKRFNMIDRLFHIFLVISFLIQTATGFGRLLITTPWGKKLVYLFGGYESASLIHRWSGTLMICGFILHILYLLRQIDLKNPLKTLFGPDSLIPDLKDFKHLQQKVLWHFGFGEQPKLRKWTYWEKFDYWAVFWGMPILAVTGLMLIYPILTSRVVPGWALNIAALIHKAEAILAVSYIFIVHFFTAHLRPESFPMNEAIFSGTVPLDQAKEEKPDWVKRLKADKKTELFIESEKAPWLRLIYFIFGYAAIVCGLYLLINTIIYSRYINFH